MSYYIYQDQEGLWHWTLIGTNNLTLAESVELYFHEADCRAAVEQVKASAAAPVVTRQTARPFPTS
jgi:uncharacterized protein YegP (UPF0339 family)